MADKGTFSETRIVDGIRRSTSAACAIKRMLRDRPYRGKLALVLS
jgi:hypothetical protein